MLCELIPAAEVEPSRIARWQALAARALEPNPWFEPHVVLPLARIRSDIVLLAAEAGDRMLACLPLIPARRKRFGISLPIWTTPHPMGVALVDPELSETALQAAFRCVSKAGGTLVLRELQAEGPVTAALMRALAGGWSPRVVPDVGRWPALRRRAQPTYVRDSLGPKQHHNMGRLRRRLEEHLDAPLRLVERGSDASAVERFLCLEHSGWKGRLGTALACDPVWADYFRKVCAGFAAEGRLHVYALEGAGTTVAMKFMVTAGPGLFELRVAYDESFARYSPGTLLEMDAVDAFHAGDWSWAVSNTNHASSPLFRVWPDRLKTADVLARAPSAIARLASWAQH